jgi:pimeloyl-ACP methyl ester carboxylesterase
VSGPVLPSESRLHEEKVRAGGLSLHLRIWGDRSKPLVLLQHGGKDHGRSWDWTVAALIDEYCLAVPDLRGHGDSNWSPGGGYDGFDMVADMAFVVEHLVRAGFQPPFDLVGHSLGGNVVLNYAASQPHRVRKAVSVEGIGFSQERYDELISKPAAQRVAEAIERRLKLGERAPRVFADENDAIRRLANLHPRLDPSQAQHLAVNGLRRVACGWSWKHDPLLGFMPIRPVPPTEYAAIHGAIEAPVLLLYGSESWASDPSRDGRLLPFRDAAFELLEGAGHWLHHDSFEAFIAQLKGFLGDSR